MMQKRFLILMGSALFALLILSQSFFVVGQNQQAIVLEFGKPVSFDDGEQKLNFINSPGLKWKVPFIQDVIFFDRRILNFAANDKEIFDSEKKNLTVTAFAKYKIIDPLAFYQKVTDERGARERMDKIIESTLRDTVGKVPLSRLLSAERKNVMETLHKTVRERMNVFGIDVLDVRIVAADLPPENSGAIYNRMRAERGKEAAEYRAQGDQEAQKIRGAADAEAIKIVADAFNRDPEFYRFYRSMQAYRETLSKDDTTIYLDPNSGFLKFLEGGKF